MTNCIFCKIVKGEINHNKVYEDKDTIAFLDISPVNKGHTLVIPKKHYELITDIPENELNAVIQTVQKIAKAINKISEGFNIFQNNKTTAGQLVPHVHFHVIPRFKGDKLKFTWPNQKYKPKEAEQLANKIKNLL